MQHAQIRQKRRFHKRTAHAKAHSTRDYVWLFQEVVLPKGSKKLLKKRRVSFQITEVHQGGRVYQLSTERAAHYEKSNHTLPHQKTGASWLTCMRMTN